jgi:integrase
VSVQATAATFGNIGGSVRMEKRSYKTDREVKALKPSDKWYDAKDMVTRNLILRVGPKRETSDGRTVFRRTFCFLSRFPSSNNPVRHALGEYGVDLTLEQARDKADEWRALIRKGIDPRKVEQAARDASRLEKEQSESQNKLVFEVVIEDFLERHVKGQRRAAQVEREIRRELIPAWKKKLVTEITRGDVVDLVEAVADRPAPYQARNIFGHVSVFFNWAIDRSKYGLETSPCDRLKPGRLIGEKKPRQRVLSDGELAALWRRTNRIGYPYGQLFLLLAITGQRKSEVAEARWREFHPELVRRLRERKDGERIDWSKLEQSLKVWTIPPERFKSDSSHLVPLTDDALQVLATLPHFDGRSGGDHLFSTTLGQKPVNSFSKAKDRLDAGMLRTLRAVARKRGGDPRQVMLPDFVLHDIRRTVRTRLSSLKVPAEVCEMIIGHGKKGLARVYDQHQFQDEMREALEAWAARLRLIANPYPAVVVPLRSARA